MATIWEEAVQYAIHSSWLTTCMAALCCYFLNEKWTVTVLILDHCHKKHSFVKDV